jgi:chromosome segregation ATPase
MPTANRPSIERQLIETSDRLKQLRSELSVADEQLAALAEEAEDARLRALVSETPLAERDHREAEKHAAAMGRHRGEVAEAIARLEQSQDDLLDRLTAAG